jgi:3-methyladenine DNA glycosylase AlkC
MSKSTFELITAEHRSRIRGLAQSARGAAPPDLVPEMESLIARIRNDIPPRKRISYGRYTITKAMGLLLHAELRKAGVGVRELGVAVLEDRAHDPFVRSLGVQLVSIEGCETGDLDTTLPIFELAATDERWEVRECSAGFVRKLVRRYPERMLAWYLRQARSDDPYLRRFACESIRPVADNRWFRERPAFCFTVMECLYAEADPYPRASVGNSLSDWSRIDEERVFGIVEELARSGDKNSYWIAYRACRNLVKSSPKRVMDALRVDEYVYKKRVYRRTDIEGEER